LIRENNFRIRCAGKNNKMKQTEELRKKVDELEKNIRNEVEKFIEETGECDIDIRTDLHWVSEVGGKRHLVSTGIKVYVTV